MKRWLVWSLVHFVVALALLLFSLDFSAVDGHEPSVWSQRAGAVVAILGQPALAVWAWLGSPDHSDAWEWALLIANSLLWGAGLACVASVFSSRPRR